MLIDVNTYTGHWPFRQLRHNTAEELLRRMDSHGIDRAVVASIHGVFYKYAHPANQELAAQTAAWRDRLVPCATLNPLYPGWQEDLRRCVDDLGLAGIRLYPQYHGYALDSEAALELVDAVTARGWFVQVPMRLVDRRQRHHLDSAPDLTAGDFERALAARPRTPWMFLNALGLDGSRLPAAASFLVELSRHTAVLQRNIQALIQTAGSEHVAFGTGMPFKVPEPALLKLQVLDVEEAVRAQIAGGNAAAMLGRDS